MAVGLSGRPAASGADEDAEDAPARPAAGRARRALQALVLALPTAWVAVLGWQHRWMTEDGFIYLRIVRQVRLGNGPVFNEGERVEAYTGTLWVGVLAVADLLTPVRLEWLSVGLGIVLTAGGIALAVDGARRLWARDGEDPFMVPLGAVVFVAVFPVWAYATSGLETGLVFAWLGACAWVLARWAAAPGSTLPAAAAVLVGLGWLVRPEMVLYSAVLLVVVAVAQRRTGWRGTLRLALVATALPLAYQLFRMGYFGSLVPNTAIAKEGTDLGWGRGWRYLVDFARPYWLWLPLVGLLAGGYLPLAARLDRRRDRRRIAVAAAFAGSAVLNAAYVVAVGGDYHHGRMFLPALFAIGAPVAAVPATRRHLAGLVVGAWAVVAAAGLRPEQHRGDAWLANGILAPGPADQVVGVTTDDLGWGEGSEKRAWYTGPGLYREAGVGTYVPLDVPPHPDLPPSTVLLWGIGVSGYSLGPEVHVVDMLGLADVLAAHMEGQPSLHPQLPRSPGHEKPLPAPWVAARVTAPGTYPDAGLFPTFGNPLIPPTTGAEFDEQVAWARAALRCDPLADLLDGPRGGLGLRGVAGNLVRSPARTRLRIPPDPEEAHRRFCGDGIPAEVRDLRGG